MQKQNQYMETDSGQQQTEYLREREFDNTNAL